MFNETLKQMLFEKRQLDLEIEKFINESLHAKFRFSAKKFTGDLGELYFYQIAAPLFTRLEQSVHSNEDCDFRGELLPEYSNLFELPPGEIRIEVKCRHDQEGNNHLFGIKTEKFDLLAFVALDSDFQCRHIGLIKASDIVVDNRDRIRYTIYYKRNLVRWQTTPWVESKKNQDTSPKK
jgi:hypothetical protein